MSFWMEQCPLTVGCYNVWLSLCVFSVRTCVCVVCVRISYDCISSSWTSMYAYVQFLNIIVCPLLFVCSIDWLVCIWGNFWFVLYFSWSYSPSCPLSFSLQKFCAENYMHKRIHIYKECKYFADWNRILLGEITLNRKIFLLIFISLFACKKEVVHFNLNVNQPIFLRSLISCSCVWQQQQQQQHRQLHSLWTSYCSKKKKKEEEIRTHKQNNNNTKKFTHKTFPMY